MSLHVPTPGFPRTSRGHQNQLKFKTTSSKPSLDVQAGVPRFPQRVTEGLAGPQGFAPPPRPPRSGPIALNAIGSVRQP